VRQRFLSDGSECSESEDSDGEPCGRVTDPDLEVNYFKKSGWYIPLPEEGERVIHRSLVRDGMILFTTVVPTQSVCETGGHGWEMTVMMENGGSQTKRYYDANTDGKVDKDDGMLINIGKGEKERKGIAGRKLSAGLPAGSVMFNDRRYTPTSGDAMDKAVAGDGSIKYKETDTCVPPEARDSESTAPACGRLSWMELQPRRN
jgi:Tfp pilus tip-associated adhesin PilY1